ncbi:MAG: hypothetical protein WC526_01205 [Patescibacteria group bacterium]
MITHRVTTKVAPEPPVRFYRTIAISFLVITLALLGIIIFFTSKSATVVIVAKNDNKNISLNVDIGSDNSSLSIPGIVTTTVFSWSEKYFPTGSDVSDGVATGKAIIYNESNISQTLVKTTRLLTSAGVLFRLSERVLVPAGGSVTADVYADQAGASGDIGPSTFTVPGLSADRQKSIYAKSTSAMSGGVKKVGILTDNDLKTAAKDYDDKVAKAVSEALGNSPYNAYDAKLVSVIDKNVKADHKAGDEVSEFTLSGTSSVAVVYYNRTSLQTLVEKSIKDKIDVTTERILSASKDPQVSLVDYDVKKNVARFSVYQDVLVTLDANADRLSVSNFFGKNKDDIERYVLSLPHVVGVDAQFSPSWMGSAPSVSDKIKVVVKSVQ